MNLKELEFDKDDKNLFQIDDLRLKADAIRHSILPKLNLLLNQAILQIKMVYDIEIFDNSHVSQSPNFRLRRNNELKVNYNWASAAITGKRKQGEWYGFIRKDGNPVRIVPFEYGIVLLEEGLSFKLICHFMKGLSDLSYSKLLRFHIDFEKELHPLCYLAEAKPVLYWGKDCEPCAPFVEHYKWMIGHGISDRFKFFDSRNIEFNLRRPESFGRAGFKFFDSRNIEFPATADQLSDLIDKFVIFYPVYDSYLQIAMGEKVRFEQLIEKLNNWLKQKSESEKREESHGCAVPAEDLLETDLQRAKELAEQRVKVMPAIRWQVFQRDVWKCVACGRSATDNVILHIDHIVPRSKGGSSTLDNYQTLCNVCNLGKSNKDITDLRRQ